MKIRRLTFLLCITCIWPLSLHLLIQEGTTVQASSLITAVSSSPLKLNMALSTALAVNNGTEQLPIIIHLQQQANLPQQNLPADVLARRTFIIQHLQTIATTSQAVLRQELDRLTQDGHATRVRAFWINNTIAAHVDAATILDLASHPDVALITLDEAFPIVAPLHPDLSDWAAVTSPNTAKMTESAWGVDRIRAPYVWYGLGKDGSGVTVAIMDSGVDWTHPDLIANYRGNLGGGVYDHTGNWYQAAIPTSTMPFDRIGHGTHVAGTAVGQNGLGVAPGARWIAVGISDNDGLIYESAIHAGFQWLLAPNGDPALAPNIVNNSWGSPLGTNMAYYDDLQVLRSAGIVPVFSAGNNGPGNGTINAPASYTNTLAIAASDDIDAIAWFSSRGPSPLTDEVKPFLAAPGTRILSAFPGGLYAIANGTSMATPHVVGTLALLLDANPALTQADMMQILANTAVPITTTMPNNMSGWGRLDAYAAVVTQISTGHIQGVVTRDGLPLPQIAVTITTAAGIPLQFDTDSTGHYQADLQSGTYTLTVAPFGSTEAQASVTLSTNQTTTRNFYLTSLPNGILKGQVRTANGGQPIISATLAAMGTPISTDTDKTGYYTITLPAGTYTVTISANGYRLLQTSTTVQIGQVHRHDFILSAAPSVLLIDGSQWYFNSAISYYEEALTRNRRSYTEISIRDPFRDIPTDSDLAQYDIVIWADSLGAPGLLNVSAVITNYLGTGGNFLVSGQNVGSYDGNGFGTQYWWFNQLRASYTGEWTGQPLPTISGADDSTFADLHLTLNGTDSAGNQTTPDHAIPQKLALTEPLLFYEDGQPAGLGAGSCDPYRIVYWGFGLEGVTDAQNRANLLASGFDYFAAPPVDSGARWLNQDRTEIALPGEQMVYTLTVQNLSATMTDTLDLALTDNVWPTQVTTPTLVLGPCTSGKTVLTVTIPVNASYDQLTHTTLTAVSRNNTAVFAQWHLDLKTPGDILLVDGDLFYEKEGDFQTAMNQMGLHYDVWDIGGSDLTLPQGEPRSDLLAAYDIVVWFTAYNWFSPVTPVSRQALLTYLQGGGRLFLSSEDFLYYPTPPQLQSYLGLLDYQTDVTPTIIYGADHPTRSSALDGSIFLDYGHIKNQGDGVLPTSDSHPYFWHDQGWAAALTTSGANWRTVFWAVPISTLSNTMRSTVLNDALGWLSDLGDSTFTIDKQTTVIGAPYTFALTIRNLPNAPTNDVSIINTLPIGLDLVPDSLTSDAIYDPIQRQILWQGRINSGGSYQIQYQAVPQSDLPSGTRLDNAVVLFYDRHHLQFKKVATVWVTAPDLSGSWLEATAVSHPTAQPQRLITYTLHLLNDGVTNAPTATALLRLPDTFMPLTSTLYTSAGAASITPHHLAWQGDLSPNMPVTVSLVLTATINTPHWWFPATAVLHDGITPPIVRQAVLRLPPYTAYFPLIANRP